MPNNEQPNFDEEFDEAVAEWRDKHRLREDDAVMLLVELFRIHQRHWDEIRRREMPSFEQFRADIAKLRGHFMDRRRPCSKCCEASHRPAVLYESLVPATASSLLRFVATGGTLNRAAVSS